MFISVSVVDAILCYCFAVFVTNQIIGAADQLPPFLRAVRKIYRTQNQYHNFQHALDVFQAVYWFLCRAGLVPAVGILSRTRDPNTRANGTKEDGQSGQFINSLGPEVNRNGGKWRRSRVKGRIGVMRNIDVFALLLAAVGHDVGHPGLSNAFMVSCVQAIGNKVLIFKL